MTKAGQYKQKNQTNYQFCPQIKKLLRPLINQFNQMRVMLITEIRDTLPENMPNGQRLCIAKKLEFLVKIIMQLKSNTFHS